MSFLAYAQAKHAFDAAKDKIEDLKSWKGNEMMDLVMLNVHKANKQKAEDAVRKRQEFHEAEMAARRT